MCLREAVLHRIRSKRPLNQRRGRSLPREVAKSSNLADDSHYSPSHRLFTKAKMGISTNLLVTRLQAQLSP